MYISLKRVHLQFAPARSTGVPPRFAVRHTFPRTSRRAGFEEFLVSGGRHHSSKRELVTLIVTIYRYDLVLLNIGLVLGVLGGECLESIDRSLGGESTEQ